jgi:hypothetical protein
MAGKVGQTIPRDERIWLVRVFMWRDSATTARDLKSFSPQGECGFKSRPGHQLNQ